MSTKLYNGIKFKSNNIREVLDQLMSIKKEANKIALNLLPDDRLSLFIATNNLLDKDAWTISRELLDALESSNSNRWTFVPRLYLSVVVYPTKEGDIYGYYFDSDKKEFNNLLKPFYNDFHYQNQTDPPNDVSEEEWNFRREKWDELLPGDKFKDSGLQYDIVTGDTLDIWDLQDKVKIILDKLKRDNKINQVVGD
jgi:hypothetical protein